MIITVTLNAAMDKTLEVPSFTPGRRHRTVDQTTMPGGKGVNIARAIKRLGQPVIATGFAGGPTGNRIVEALNDESILNDFVRIADESRTNTAVLDPTTGLQTEINERGPAVSAQELELFREKLLYLAQGASICVFAGSLPRGVETDIYFSLIREVRRLGVTTMIDTDGEPLRLSMRAEPDLVSPNELEAEELVGHEFNDADDRAPGGGGDDAAGRPRGDHDRVGRLLRAHLRGRLARAVPRPHRRAGGPVGGGLGRRLPGRLRLRALRRSRPRRVPALRRRVRGGVDAALRRRHPGRRRGSTGCWARSRPSACRSAPRSAEPESADPGPVSAPAGRRRRRA